ncbi:MAG: DEAD/DEAH box helicase [Anaerolineae bacterium]
MNRSMNKRCGIWGVWLAAMVLCVGGLAGLATGEEEDVGEETGEATAPRLAVAPFDAAAAKEHQEAWAKHLGVKVKIKNSIGMKLALIYPEVIRDLPDKFEQRIFCNLTREQATLYEAIVQSGLTGLPDGDEAAGMQRRGMVLAMLTRLKQVCNHPALFLADGSALGSRSGKLNRLTEMLEEILEMGERALIFTQYAQMGFLLQNHLRDTYGREVLFLHGGTSQRQRDRMLERFQESADAPGIFVLSLKAGGTGLNLMRANHVFHYDRWWNPAVENQATDRAYRIGQTRDVQVHKFICLGTLEERIDALIESKRELADAVIGQGDSWVTELTTDQLYDLVTLRSEAVETD